jgi:hypothetical protein
MKIYILTRSPFKEKELSRYFNNIGLATTHLSLNAQLENIPADEDYICVTEQTQLLSKHTHLKCQLDKFEEVIHYSEIVLNIRINGIPETRTYQSSLEGFIFPYLKTDRKDVYNWDDIFVSATTMKSYQDMKDQGIKNSARDITFALMMDDLPSIFQFDKINLNFNPVQNNEVISFEPVIEDLFKNNRYYKLAYKNEVFKSLLDYIISDGLFIRRASNRKQKNYWLPGLNAGIPLTPKKDELHELTFMFHDIMHFFFPDLIVTANDKASKHKYFIARMVSEAFTLVLADILFISLLKDDNIEYDYTKRKIFPLFENIKFDITKQNMPKVKELLWANTCFALLGDDKLRKLVKNDTVFEIYKSKYQQIFQDDYIWTVHNYGNIAKNHEQNKSWLEMIKNVSGDILTGTDSFCPQFDINSDMQEQVRCVFETMYNKLEGIVLNNVILSEGKKRAVQRYVAGQCFIFYKFDTVYNKLFLEQIKEALKVEFPDIQNIKYIYNTYIDALAKDNFITRYEAENYKNIYPFFEPFYVFYERDKNETFADTLNRIFERNT